MATTSDRIPGISEKQFLRQVRELARWSGWLTYHTHNSQRSEPGFTDLVLVRPPNVLFVELKTDIGCLSLEQRVWIEALGGCPGIEVHVWRPGDWDAIVERLQKRDIAGRHGISWDESGQKA